MLRWRGPGEPATLIALDVRGPILSTANSCASGAVALGEALGDLREGRVDAAIAGAWEIPPSLRSPSARFLTSSGTVRWPQRCGRGPPPGRSTPGATGSSWARRAVVPESAVARSGAASIPAKCRGTRQVARPRTRTTWSSRGPMRARGARPPRLRLDRCGRGSRGDRLASNAHMPRRTPIGDIAEARAIATSLARGHGARVSGTKALYGHPLGASGAIEASDRHVRWPSAAMAGRRRRSNPASRPRPGGSRLSSPGCSSMPTRGELSAGALHLVWPGAGPANAALSCSVFAAGLSGGEAVSAERADVQQTDPTVPPFRGRRLWRTASSKVQSSRVGADGRLGRP